MPPKEDQKAQKAPKKSQVDYKDDKGNSIPFEDWMSLIRRKYTSFCKAQNVQQYEVLIDKIKNSIDSDDKSLVGVPFTTLTIANAQANQLESIFEFVAIYEKIQSITLSGVQILPEAMQSLNMALNLSKSTKFIAFENCKISSDSFREFFAGMPETQLISFEFDGITLDSEVLMSMGLMIEKYIQNCRQLAEAAIEEAAAKHEEDLEKLERENANRKKKKVWKAKKGEKVIFDKTVDQIYMDYFQLKSVQLYNNDITILAAPALGAAIEKMCPYLEEITIRNQSFGAVGLGEIGSGLLRASMLRDQQMKALRSQLHPHELETFTGNILIKLEALVIENCCIQEDIEAAYERFGEGLMTCGRLKEVDLRDNCLQGKEKWLIPEFILQKSLIKAKLPETCSASQIKELAGKLREHRKAQEAWLKEAKKMAKEAKKKAKIEKKANKLAKLAEAKAAKEAKLAQKGQTGDNEKEKQEVA